ncbi:MAG TPA: helix-turn-helix transcriptional regulator [Polyangiaceae bacterium]
MTDIIADYLATNLRNLRESRGWSQQQLADISRVPRPTIAHLESGEGNPTLNVLVRVATALGVSIEHLVRSANSALEIALGESLPTRPIGQALSRRLHAEISGTQVERIEIPARCQCAFGPATANLQQIVSCESGRIDVRSKEESRKLRVGDVLRVRGQRTLTFENPSARLAIVVVVTLPLVPGS